MIAFKLMLLVLMFLIGNCIVGMFLLALCKGTASKHDTENQEYALALLVGTGFLFAIFAILTFMVIYKGAGFHVLNKLFLLVYFVVFVCSLVVLVTVKRFRNYVLKSLVGTKSKTYWSAQCLLVVCFLIIGVTFFMHRPYLESRFDLPERMNTLEATGTFGGSNPLTGEESEMPSVLQQWTKGVVPAWYLFFSGLLGVPTYRMLFQVVPLWTLALCMSAYSVIAKVLFGKNRKRLVYFMTFFTFFTLCGNGAYMNPTYGLLHYGYEESTLLSNVVLPCVFAVVLWMIKRTGVKTWQNFWTKWN